MKIYKVSFCLLLCDDLEQIFTHDTFPSFTLSLKFGKQSSFTEKKNNEDIKNVQKYNSQKSTDEDNVCNLN